MKEGNNSLLNLLQQNWGYTSFRPLQEEAVTAVREGRDSLVILPTGGGKSLCYQLPALVMEGMAVVISPLISLMKDQVDQLTSRGIEAACLNSSLSPNDKMAVDRQIKDGQLKLLYVAPERLLGGSFLTYLKQFPISFFAIDEAHCISQWGHDFRPEYRALKILRKEFPEVALHSYTATATQKVRHDIVQQLGLPDPEILVGSFDRPNLHYSVARSGKKKEKLLQLCGLVERHKGESGIVYCISRKSVEELAKALNDNGYRAIPYHAGLEDEPRKRAQEQFLNEKVDIIVATVAFGMGIDKTNVRYVVHWGMPKSIEHYQQESGRAGRDGLDSDCLLFYSIADLITWKRILVDLEPEHQRIAFTQLEEMESYANTTRCRHRYLVEYFGQAFEKEGCGACDLCLGNIETNPDSLVIAQKILSCVIRLNQRFGVKHTIDVLRGSKAARVIQFRHHELSTYGLLEESPASHVEDWIAQLCEQGFLSRNDEHKTLFVTADGNDVLKGEKIPRLVQFESPPIEAFIDDSWEGVDTNLFAKLKELRTRLAAEEKIPPYVVFGDAALRDMGRKRPSTHRSFLMVEGVGKKKKEKYGDLFLEAINNYCEKNGLEMDIFTRSPKSPIKLKPIMNGTKQKAFDLFGRRKNVEEVASQIERASSTTRGYLAEYLDAEKIIDPTPWIDGALHERIGNTIERVGMDRLRPIFEDLGGEIPYDQIRVSVTCWKNRDAANESSQS